MLLTEGGLQHLIGVKKVEYTFEVKNVELHSFAGLQMSDCKLQNLVRIDFSSPLTHVLPRILLSRLKQVNDKCLRERPCCLRNVAVELEFLSCEFQLPRDRSGTVMENGPCCVRKEGVCVVLRWRETSRVPSQALSHTCVNTVATVMRT